MVIGRAPAAARSACPEGRPLGAGDPRSVPAAIPRGHFDQWGVTTRLGHVDDDVIRVRP